MTFTRKAGSELAERIRRELTHCGRPDLARQVDGGAIGTIHGLCRRLLKEQALRARIDPSFTILEPDAGRLVKEEVSKQAWSRAVEEAGEDELEALATRGDGLRKQMLSLYDRLRGMGQEMPQLHIEPGPPADAARAALAEACRDALGEARRLPKRGPSLDSDLEKIVACVEWLDADDGRGRGADGGGDDRFLPQPDDPLGRAVAGSGQGGSDAISVCPRGGGASPGHHRHQQAARSVPPGVRGL